MHTSNIPTPVLRVSQQFYSLSSLGHFCENCNRFKSSLF